MSFSHFHEWPEVEPQIEHDWKTKYEPMGIDWDEVKDAARFGWDAASLPEYQGKSFEQVESDLKSHWSLPQDPDEEETWDYVRDAVKMAYDKSRSHRHNA